MNTSKLHQVCHGDGQKPPPPPRRQQKAEGIEASLGTKVLVPTDRTKVNVELAGKRLQEINAVGTIDAEIVEQRRAERHLGRRETKLAGYKRADLLGQQVG